MSHIISVVNLAIFKNECQKEDVNEKTYIAMRLSQRHDTGWSAVRVDLICVRVLDGAVLM
jgi:hypothetical protein